MKHLSFFTFLALFRRLGKKHFYAVLADASFLLLAAIGVLGLQWFQQWLVTQSQSLNLVSALASPSAEQAAAIQGFALQLIGVIVIFALYLILAWILTRALVWKFLLGMPRGVSFFKLWLKLIIPNILWMLITLVPLYFALFKLAQLYENPLVQIASKPAGYAYIFFLYLIIVVLILAYCHLTNIFYLVYFKTPRLRAVWNALKVGIGDFPRWAKPLGILSLFFVVTIVASLVAMPLPEPFKTAISFGFLFFFALVSRVWYATVYPAS